MRRDCQIHLAKDEMAKMMPSAEALEPLQSSESVGIYIKLSLVAWEHYPGGGDQRHVRPMQLPPLQGLCKARFSTMFSMAAKVAQLREVLGVTSAVARGLLEQSGGELEGAVALHVAGVGPAQPQTPRSLLVSTLDGALDRTQAQRLLQRAGGRVEAAVDLFFTSGVPQASDEGPISLDSDDDSQEGEEGEEQRTRRQPARRPSSQSLRGGGGAGGSGLVSRRRSTAGAGRGLVRSPERRRIAAAVAAALPPPRLSGLFTHAYSQPPNEVSSSGSESEYSDGGDEEEEEEEWSLEESGAQLLARHALDPRSCWQDMHWTRAACWLSPTLLHPAPARRRAQGFRDCMPRRPRVCQT